MICFDEFNRNYLNKETVDFVKKLKAKKIITEEMVKDNPKLKVTSPDDSNKHYENNNVYEINRKNAYKAALKNEPKRQN